MQRSPCSRKRPWQRLTRKDFVTGRFYKTFSESRQSIWLQSIRVIIRTSETGRTTLHSDVISERGLKSRVWSQVATQESPVLAGGKKPTLIDVPLIDPKETTTPKNQPGTSSTESKCHSPSGFWLPVATAGRGLRGKKGSSVKLR